MPPYTLDSLAKLAGVTPRTIRYYIAQGLLPAPDFAGSATRYDDTHVALLRAIKRMQADHLPLASIRDRLGGIAPDELARLAEPTWQPAPDRGAALDYIREVLGGDAHPRPPEPGELDTTVHATAFRMMSAPVPAPSPPSAPSAPAPGGRSQWERIALEPDIELHVRRPLTRQQNRRLERLVKLHGELLQEEE
jgi:DNA-binding transcriptional MerR regulator